MGVSQDGKENSKQNADNIDGLDENQAGHIDSDGLEHERIEHALIDEDGFDEDSLSGHAVESRRTLEGTAVPKSSLHIIPLIIVALLVGIVVSAWFLYQQYEKDLAGLHALYAKQQQQIVSSADAADEKLKASTRTVQQLNEKIKDLEVSLLNLQKQNKHFRSDWLVLEAEYLVNIANQRLLFESDVATSIVALQAADERLRESGDPGLVSIRKILLESIQALKAIPQPDIAGLSLQLSVISANIEKLPSLIPDIGKQADVAATDNKVDSWSDLPAAIWKDVKTLVVIRHHDEPVPPLLTPEQEFFLLENLRLQIEQARLAMLSGQAEVYVERIETAIKWIERYFDVEAELTKASLATLNDLKQINIAPVLPDITKTYVAIKKYRTGTQNKAK